MIAYIWPIALVVFANVMYQICAKSMPGDINPFAALMVTYMVAFLSSGILYFVLNRGAANLFAEYSKLNWVPFVFGIVLVALIFGGLCCGVGLLTGADIDRIVMNLDEHYQVKTYFNTYLGYVTQLLENLKGLFV